MKRKKENHSAYFPPPHDAMEGDVSKLVGQVNLIGLFAVGLGGVSYTGIIMSFDIAFIVLYMAYQSIFMKMGNLGRWNAHHRKLYKPVEKLIKTKQFLYVGAKFRLGLYVAVSLAIFLFLGPERLKEVLLDVNIVYGYFNPGGIFIAAVFMGVYVHTMHYRDRMITMREFYDTVQYVKARHGMKTEEAKNFSYEQWYDIQAERRGQTQNVQAQPLQERELVTPQTTKQRGDGRKPAPPPAQPGSVEIMSRRQNRV